MYASLAIQPPVQTPSNTAAPNAASASVAAEAQGFGEALRRAVACPVGLAGLGAMAAEAPAAIPGATPTAPPALALAPGSGEAAEIMELAALLPAAFALAASEAEPASAPEAQAADDMAEALQGSNPAAPAADGLAAMLGLVMMPPPMPAPATPAMVAMAPAAMAAAATPAPTPVPAPVPATIAPEAAPAANPLQLKAASQRGSAAAAPGGAEHALPAAEAAPSATAPAPLAPMPAAPPPVAHAAAHHAPAPPALAPQAEASATADTQPALLPAMPQPPGLAPREAGPAAPMPPARQVMPMAMAMLLSPGATPTLSVTLDPAELGRLEIRVGREAGGASLRLIAERPETLSLLVRDQRDLQQGLAQSGITLNADGIRFEMAEQDGHARQEQQRRPGSRRPQGEANSTSPQQAFQLSLLDIHI